MPDISVRPPCNHTNCAQKFFVLSKSAGCWQLVWTIAVYLNSHYSFSVLTCGKNPLIVGPNQRLPDEPFDNLVLPSCHTGCNQLKCKRCGEVVRTQLAVGAHSRMYVCSCQSRNVDSVETVGAQDLYHDIYGEYTRTDIDHWYCAGHPHLILPVKLNGIRIAEDADFDEIARQAAFAPHLVLDRSRPALWLERLYYLLSPQLHPALGAAIARLLTSTDTRPVLMALAFFNWNPQADGAEHVLPLVQRERNRLLKLVAPEQPTKTALHVALGVLCRRIRARGEPESHNAQIIALLQRELLAGVDAAGPWGGGGMSERYLTEHTPRWLDEHYEQLVVAFGGVK
jgi:hypothetical protein